MVFVVYKNKIYKAMIMITHHTKKQPLSSLRFSLLIRAPLLRAPNVYILSQASTPSGHPYERPNNFCSTCASRLLLRAESPYSLSLSLEKANLISGSSPTLDRTHRISCVSSSKRERVAEADLRASFFGASKRVRLSHVGVFSRSYIQVPAFFSRSLMMQTLGGWYITIA